MVCSLTALSCSRDGEGASISVNGRLVIRQAGCKTHLWDQRTNYCLHMCSTSCQLLFYFLFDLSVPCLTFSLLFLISIFPCPSLPVYFLSVHFVCLNLFVLPDISVNNVFLLSSLLNFPFPQWVITWLLPPVSNRLLPLLHLFAFPGYPSAFSLWFLFVSSALLTCLSSLLTLCVWERVFYWDFPVCILVFLFDCCC